MGNFSRRAVVIGAFILIVFAGYFLGVRRLISSGPPIEFTEARSRGAAVSEEIVNLSNEISRDLEAVSKLDAEGKSWEALDAIVLLLQKTADIKQRATGLSRELEAMTAALLQVRSREAQQAAMESITQRMALISRLMSYADYLTQLSEVLRKHFTETPTKENVGVIVAQVNAEITAINNFNNQAAQAMDRFDAIIGAR